MNKIDLESQLSLPLDFLVYIRLNLVGLLIGILISTFMPKSYLVILVLPFITLFTIYLYNYVRYLFRLMMIKWYELVILDTVFTLVINKEAYISNKEVKIVDETKYKKSDMYKRYLVNYNRYEDIKTGVIKQHKDNQKLSNPEATYQSKIIQEIGVYNYIREAKDNRKKLNIYFILISILRVFMNLAILFTILVLIGLVTKYTIYTDILITFLNILIYLYIIITITKLIIPSVINKAEEEQTFRNKELINKLVDLDNTVEDLYNKEYDRIHNLIDVSKSR